MLSLRSLVAVMALSSCSAAFPALFGRSAVKSHIAESLKSAPNGWVLDTTTVVDKDESSIKLRINMVQPGKDKFHELAMNIATPGHEMYGAHLSQQAINEMVAPKEESHELVMNWLKSQNLESYASDSLRGDAVIVQASVSQIESLLNATYNRYIRTDNGDAVMRTLEYSLPDSLNGHIAMVQPTTFFGLRAMKSTISEVKPLEKLDTESVAAVTGCTGTIITPTCLANLYNFASSTSTQTTGRMGIAGFLEQWPSAKDLTTFMSKYAFFANKADTYTCTLINGGTCPTTPSPVGVEANLDVQYARAITKDIPNVYYSTGGSPPYLGDGTDNEPYLEFLDYMLALTDANLPNTLSISYGDDESTVPLDYADSTCTLFAQLGARGVSVLVASGDSGVGDTCKVGTTKTFTTSYPASCPWVTTVGGTTSNSPETAWSGSGGGFSSVFGRPSYQTTAVTKWLTTDTTHASVTQYFNSSGRAYPDVAAQSTNFEVVISSVAEAVSGTSCASPTFASIIQLLNSARIASGKKGLGFLNPWLYSNATAGLTDITSGKNTGCSGVISGAGFSAVAGWDPATGLGTPNYANLLTIAQATA